MQLNTPGKDGSFSCLLPAKMLLIMKLVTVLIIVSTLQVSAKTYAQEISLSRHNATLEEVLNDIHLQTGYLFLFGNRALKDIKGIDVAVRKATLQQTLDQCVAKYSLGYIVEDRTIIVFPKEATAAVLDPSQMIKGIVTDKEGKALPGVTIRIKNSNIGTVTDAEGHFQIDVAGNNTVLQISFLGFRTQEVVVGSRSELNLVLEASASNLNGLVVVGYGTQKKVDLTGAVDQVSGERLESRPITNVSEGLQGVMANLNVYTTYSGGAPGATKSINIRGYTGLGSSASPLILVDGVPADINSINPADIESITVLKDAASSAIYGSRAPYGVVLIKTKQGKKGQPLTVSLNSNFSFSQPIDYPKMMNSLQFVTIYNEAFKNAGQSLGFTEVGADECRVPLERFIAIAHR